MSRRDLEFTGSLFETQICSMLKVEFPESEVINNLEVFSHYLGKSTQIDVILVTQKCIVFVEAKNWTNWVKGNYNDFHWTGRGKSKNVMTVFNPINQNKIHVRAVKNALHRKGLLLPVIHNIVCFPDGCMINSDSSDVVNYSQLRNKIASIESESKYTLDYHGIKDAILSCEEE